MKSHILGYLHALQSIALVTLENNGHFLSTLNNVREFENAGDKNKHFGDAYL